MVRSVLDAVHGPPIRSNNDPLKIRKTSPFVIQHSDDEHPKHENCDLDIQPSDFKVNVLI